MSIKNSTFGNVDLNTGYTYTANTVVGSSFNMNDLMSDLNLVTFSIQNPGLTLNTNSPYSYTNTSWGSAKINISQTGIDMESDCDIKIGNRSLKDFMEQMEQRLALLNVNLALESEWEELKQLGDRYRQLEKEIKEKMRTWDILKKDDEFDQKTR